MKTKSTQSTWRWCRGGSRTGTIEVGEARSRPWSAQGLGPTAAVAGSPEQHLGLPPLPRGTTAQQEPPGVRLRKLCRPPRTSMEEGPHAGGGGDDSGSVVPRAHFSPPCCLHVSVLSAKRPSIQMRTLPSPGVQSDTRFVLRCAARDVCCTQNVFCCTGPVWAYFL